MLAILRYLKPAMYSLRVTAGGMALTVLMAGHLQANADRSLSPRTFEVIEFSSPPAYRLTRDQNDREQLSDGVLNPFPFWTHRASVGWSQATPVVITGRLRSESGRAGVLSFRVARRTKAGVEPPARIDAYCAADDAAVRHSGSYQSPERDLDDTSIHNIDVPVGTACARVHLVVHAQGTNIFIDEITLKPSSVVAPELPDDTVLTRDEIVTDSLTRLREAYLSRDAARQLSLATASRGSSLLSVTTCDPWARELLPDGAGIPARRIEIMGVRGEHEAFCLVIAASPPDAVVSVRVAGDAKGVVSLFEIAAVVTADGRVARDPLIPLDVPSSRLAIRNGLAYIWGDVDLAVTTGSAVSIPIEFELESQSTTAAIDVSVSVIDVGQTTSRVMGTAWGYSDAMPIWRTREAAAKDLAAHGVNVAVIPPHRFPQPNENGTWDVGSTVKLTDDLRLFGAGTKLFLLALGWSPGVKPAWLPPQYADWTDEHRATLRSWYSKLERVMERAELLPSQWALYPVDEPHGRKADFLRSIIMGFDAIGIHPRWYANPSEARRGAMSTEALKEIAPFVHYWQPSLKFAERSGRAFFRALEKEWWVYHNPPYPAKSASPLTHYLLPAWRAWVLGAHGTGVWSYSDTQSSSAWDDLDGRRADWAMVYEGDESPIGSRRWEAFRNGLEDLTLLTRLQAKGCVMSGLKALVLGAIDDTRATSRARDEVRAKLFDQPCLRQRAP